MPSPILEARSHTLLEEIDYVYLITTLQNWAAPRNVISRLVKSNDLIRIKKGIYVFGPSYAKRPYSLEILANKIYGPSYISREYALSYWGLIPEGVKEVTSMTTGRKKNFTTPIGRFSYLHLPTHQYAVGLTQIQVADFGALIATPEKALIDLLLTRKIDKLNLRSLSELLFEDLRIEPAAFYDLSRERLTELSNVIEKPFVNLLIQLMDEN